MKKEEILGIIALIVLSIGIIGVVFVSETEKEKLNKIIDKQQESINKQNKVIQEKTDIIFSLNKELIDKDTSCEWLRSFYFEHVCDVNGCEVRE